MIMRKCHKDGCTAAAEFSVGLHISCPAPGLVPRVIGLKCSIEVCEEHKGEVAGYVLSDVNKEMIVATLMDQGLPEPDFLSAVFDFTPIETPALGAVAEVQPEPVADEPLIAPLIMWCDRLDDAGERCTNPARYQVMMRYRALAQRGKGDPICDSLTNMHVCGKHKRQVKAADFLDAESRLATMQFLAAKGFLHCDVDHPIIEFVQLVGGEPETKKKRLITL